MILCIVLKIMQDTCDLSYLFQGVLLSRYIPKNKEIITIFFLKSSLLHCILIASQWESYQFQNCVVIGFYTSFCSREYKLFQKTICCFHKRPLHRISAISVKVLAPRLFQQENLDLGTLVHLLNFILSALASMT